MAKKSVNNLGFKFTDGGDLEVDGFEEGDEFEDPFAEEGEEEEGEEEQEFEGDEEFEEDSEEEDKPSDSDARLSRLEGLMEKLLLSIATGDKPSKKVDDDEEEEEEVPEELDNKTMVKLLSKRIDKSIGKRFDEEMSKHTPALEQANLNAQFQKYAAQLGQKFVDNIPAVARIMLDGEIRDVGKAWKILQAMNSGGRQSKKVSVNKTVQKLRRREVDADSRDSVGEMRQLYPRTPFQKLKGNDNDVFDKAFTSALIDATRGSRRRR